MMKKTTAIYGIAIMASIATVAYAQMPQAPSSFAKSNDTAKTEVQADNKSTNTKTTKAEDKVFFAIEEGVAVKGAKPIFVKIHDKEFIAEVNKEIKGKKLTAEEVIIKGIVQPTKTDNGQALKVTWNSVATEDDSKTSTLAIPFKSMLQPEEPGAIPPATKFAAYGEKQELKEAIKKLANLQPIVEEQKITEKTENSKKSNTGGFDARSNSNGGNESIGSLDRTPIDFSQQENQNATFGTTKEGCEPRIDWNSEKVYPTAATIKITGGSEERIGDCMDSNIPYDIKYDYLACENKIDMANLQVIPYRQAYYINELGEKAIIKECSPEENRTYAVEEEKGACNDVLDSQMTKATEAVTLIYRNNQNNRIVIEQCTITENSRSFALRDKICGHIPDFDNNTVIVSTQKVYDKDGQTIAKTNCTESEERVKLLWDTTSCKSEIDFESMTFVEMARPMVEIDGKNEYLGVCMPKTPDSEVLTTNVGCETQHADYIEDGYSNGFVKYYQNINGKKKYLTDCVEYPKTQYKHKKELTSYEHEDNYYRSFPKYRTYIELPYPAENTFITPEETDYTVSLPYVTKDVSQISMGEFKHEGCFKYERMQKAMTWERPDKTNYYLPLEEIESKLLGDVCVLSAQKIKSSIKEYMKYNKTITTKGWVEQCDGRCKDRVVNTYLGNSIGQVECWSWEAIETQTEIRIKLNTETGEEFTSEGLTTTVSLECKGDKESKGTYCGETWTSTTASWSRSCEGNTQ